MLVRVGDRGRGCLTCYTEPRGPFPGDVRASLVGAWHRAAPSRMSALFPQNVPSPPPPARVSCHENSATQRRVSTFGQPSLVATYAPE